VLQLLTQLVFPDESLKQQEVFFNVARASTRRSIALAKDDSAEVTPTVLHDHTEKRRELGENTSTVMAAFMRCEAGRGAPTSPG
jgi:hypothetical protein